MHIIYWPGFETSVQEGLHLQDDSFAHLLLMVSALGSPYVDDPCVLIDGSPLSSRWKYLHQVPLVQQSLLTAAILYELQVCCASTALLYSEHCHDHCLSACLYISCVVVNPSGVLADAWYRRLHGLGSGHPPQAGLFQEAKCARGAMEAMLLVQQQLLPSLVTHVNPCPGCS